MIRKADPKTDQVMRSFLQKAVRRGDPELTKVIAECLIQTGEFQWMRKRLAVITFEECWPYGLEVEFANDKDVILKHYLALAKAVKNKNAAGLGSLAYALSQGDESVLSGKKSDKLIWILAKGIKESKQYWQWIFDQDLPSDKSRLVQNAFSGFKKSGWPWDRAFAQSAALLALVSDVPKITLLGQPKIADVPMWVGIDKHTKVGKIAIREAAKIKGIKSNSALWLAFYFESAQCNKLERSPWWEREIQWRMNKLSLSYEKGKDIWLDLKPIVENLLHNDGKNLHKKLYTMQQTDETTVRTAQLNFP